jgi:hypothetical protein
MLCLNYKILLLAVFIQQSNISIYIRAMHSFTFLVTVKLGYNEHG